MPGKLKASDKLYVLAIVMSVFMIGIGLYGISVVKKMNNNTETLYADRIVPMEQLTTIRNAYLAGIISKVEEAQTQHLSYKAAIKELQQSEETIRTNWKAYLQTYLTSKESELTKEAAPLMDQSFKFIEGVKGIMSREETNALNYSINNELYQNIKPTVQKINELINLQTSVAKELYKNNNDVYHKTIKQFILLITLSLLFALPFSFFLVKSVKNLIRNLAESESKYRNIFENVQDVFYQTSLTGVILDVSPSIKNHTGYTREELIGTNAVNLFFDPADRKKGLELLWEKGQLKDYELLFKTRTSEPFYISLNAVLIKGADGYPIHQDGSFRNITEKKMFEQKLTKAAIKAQEDEKFNIGGELHDNVCQILTTSMIFLRMMETALPSELQEVYTKIQGHITKATNEIRDLSHRLAPAFFDEETLEEAFDHLLKTFNVEKKYVIVLNFDNYSKTHPLSRDLMLNLYRILQEQLRNIFKHANANKITVAVATNENVLHMKIEDNGVGFDAVAGRNGIGLANMNRRVQLYSGSLKIDSTVGKGCSVVVEVPLKPDVTTTS